MGLRSVLLLAIAVYGLRPQRVAGGAVVPAMQRVITMLDNLLTENEAEAKADLEQHDAYKALATTEIDTTTDEIGRLDGEVELLESTLTTLNAKKLELKSTLTPLLADITTTETAMTFATQKRNTEKADFAVEQNDFANAISACGKAVKLLAAKYGDGTPEADPERPDFMTSLISKTIDTVRKAAAPLRKVKGQAAMKLASFLQQGAKGPFDRYEAASGDGLNIVDQIKVLKTSFEEDKKSGIADEKRLQDSYDKLMKEKGETLATMKSERDSLQSRLQQNTQDIAESEGEKSRTERELGDAQTLLTSTKTQLADAITAYGQRKKDREEEHEAVTMAVGKLSEYREGFVQEKALTSRDSKGATRHQKATAAGLKRVAAKAHLRGQDAPPCRQCIRAASLLTQRAKGLHSSMLQAAAEAAMGLEAIDEIVTAIENLADRLDAEQKAEAEHKAWCEKEIKDTNDKKTEHTNNIETLKGVIAALQEVVAEKDQSLTQNSDDVVTEDGNFDKATTMRKNAKDLYEHDHEEHVDAIMALNEAIDILAKYFQSKSAALIAVRRGLEAPKSGKQVVDLISGTRSEFEVAKKHLEDEESKAITTFNGVKAAHVKTISDLDDEKNTLTVEKQTAEGAIDSNTDDKKSSEDEVKSAKTYLGKLGKSCAPLLQHFDERKKMRAEEKKALEDAIKVLQESA